MNELAFIRTEKRKMRMYINKFRALGNDYDPDDDDYDAGNPYAMLGSFMVLARKLDGSLCKKIVYDAPCHYDLKANGYEFMPAGCAPISVVDYTHRIEMLDDSIQQHAKSFITYIAYESPWAVCYVNKGRKRYKHEWELNVNRTGNEVASACIAMRQAYEFGKSFLLAWGELLKHGVSKDVAWLASYFLSYNGKEWSNSYWHGGHDAMSTSTTSSCVFDFFANGINPDNDRYNRDSYKDNPKYNNVYGVIGTERGWRQPGCIEEWVREHCKEEVSGNGFSIKKTITLKSVLDLCADIQNELNKAKK